MTTYNVTAGDATSLRDAIDSANSDGDDSTVNVPAGTYNLGAHNPGLQIFGDGSFTLVGAGARSTIIDGGAGPITAGDTGSTDDTIFTIVAFCDCKLPPANATFSGITVQGANPRVEGAAFNVQNDGPGLQASLHLLDSTITGNQAGDSDGGGIYNEGTLTVDRVTFSNNFSDADGSAIANENFNEGFGAARGISLIATVAITNSTFTNNTADSNAGGAGQGVILNNGGAITITNSTIDHNTNLDGSGDGYGPTGGLASEGGNIDVVNSIVSNNTASPEEVTSTAPRGETAATRGSGPTIAANCATDPESTGTITSLGHNIETATDCGFTASGDQQNTDPILGTLANNGGQMDTLALLSGSPAIDHADAAHCPATDEIGTTRPQGPACDVGAFEVVVPPPPAPPVTPPVTPAKPAAPKVGVAGVRRACVSRSFHLRFHIATATSVKRVVVKLDGKRIKSTTRGSFTLTINAKRLKAGRHRLTITATDSAGQTTTSHRTFSVCKAAKPRRKAAPRFTG